MNAQNDNEKMNLKKSLIIRCFVGTVLCSEAIAFSTGNSLLLSRFRQQSTTSCQNWLGDLWEELIEFSTYGPEERKLLKAKREKAAAAAIREDGGDISMDSFQRAQQKYEEKMSEKADDPLPPLEGDEDSLSLRSFQAAVATSADNKKGEDEIDFDGYKLRDLLVSKWGIPLDIDFQRGYDGGTVYCTVLPVAFGSSRCRHESELDYLMHLQGVVEILKKYDNLDLFIFFIQKTNKVPKPGIESAPYLMKLDDEALQKILKVN